MATKFWALSLFVIVNFVISTTFAEANCTSKEILCGGCSENDEWDSSTEDYIDGDYSYNPVDVYDREKCEQEVTDTCSRQVYEGALDGYCCEKILQLGEECSKKMLKRLVEKLLKRLVKYKKNKDEIKKRVRRRAKLAYKECKNYVGGGVH